MADAHRVVVFRDGTQWRWKAQATNWRIVDRARRTYATFGKARQAARARYPDAEIVIDDAH